MISIKRLRDFWRLHADAEIPLRRWHKVVSKAKWTSFAQIRKDFPHADSVKTISGTTMIVFNVGGNNYRVIARVLYEYGRVYVKEALTHATYSKDKWKQRM